MNAAAPTTTVAPLLAWLAAACVGGDGLSETDITRDSAGVEVVALNEIELCASCELEPVLSARLGEPSGPGMVEGDFAFVDFDPSTATWGVVWNGGESEVDLFDSAGRYLRSVGSAGEGPGEFGRRPSRFTLRDGELTVLNYPRRNWLVFRDDGTLVEDRPAPVSGAVRYVLVRPDTAVVTTSSAGGAPVVALSTWAIVDTVPAEVFEREVTESRYRGPRVVTTGREDQTLATMWPDRLEIREWSLDGRLLSVIRGEPERYPEVLAPWEEGDPPQSRLDSFMFDAAGRLWLLVYEPADTWREYQSALRDLAGRGEVAVRSLQDLPRSVAPRVDVFDLKRGTHLGTWTSDAYQLGLLDRDGEVVAYVVEADETPAPSLAVYRFELPEG